MHAQQIHTLLLILTLVLSLFSVTAAAKYGQWARVMVPESGSWLFLVFYLGTVPFLSFIYSAANLVLLHLNIIPISSVQPLTTTKPAITLAAATILFAMSIIQFLSWLGQSALCTACELAPILQNHQGQMPKWCPQASFVDKGVKGLPDMLAGCALAKDIAAWIMVLVSIVLIECARRQWSRARLMDGEITIGMNADYETGWKGGASEASGVSRPYGMTRIDGGNKEAEAEVYEMSNIHQSERPLPTAPAARPGYVEIGAPPSRKTTVAVGLNPGTGYETRF